MARPHPKKRLILAEIVPLKRARAIMIPGRYRYGIKIFSKAIRFLVNCTLDKRSVKSRGKLPGSTLSIDESSLELGEYGNALNSVVKKIAEGFVVNSQEMTKLNKLNEKIISNLEQIEALIIGISNIIETKQRGHYFEQEISYDGFHDKSKGKIKREIRFSKKEINAINEFMANYGDKCACSRFSDSVRFLVNFSLKRKHFSLPHDFEQCVLVLRKNEISMKKVQTLFEQLCKLYETGSIPDDVNLEEKIDKIFHKISDNYMHTSKLKRTIIQNR